MAEKPLNWKKGRGKLGVLAPLDGSWQANAETVMGSVVCSRKFEKILSGRYIQLTANWQFGDKSYVEIAMIGINNQGEVAFWSFTSDGKNSTGLLADVTDIHPQAVGFEAHMDAGLARMAYWPDDDSGFFWVVESKTKKGWNRFVEHHYYRV
jgi:hypothetical protein